MKAIIFYILFFLSYMQLFATAQTPDYLLIGKDTLKLHTNPLEEYFIKNPFPDGIVTLHSSGNWRGYIAYFKFLDNKLVVENIYKEEYKENTKGEHDYFLTSIYKEVFGTNLNFECSYYTGLLICPYGERLQYVHMGYSSIYEFYKLFEIHSGQSVKSKELTGEEYNAFKRDYYKYFKTTEAFKIEKESFRKMFQESNEDLGKMQEAIEGTSKKKKTRKKENKYLKEKEAAYEEDKMIDSFMYQFSSNYIKTIDIPKND